MKFVILTGMSGAGKSTLVGVLTGLLGVDSGKVLVDGASAVPSPGFLNIGYVPQSPYIVDATLAENVAFREWGSPPDEERVRACCQMASIDFLDDLVRIYQCSILEQSSLYLAVEGKKEFIPSSLENEEPDEELRREKMRKMAEKIRKVISVEKIQNYVNRYLAEKDELEASQLPLNNEEDFIKLIYVRLYGQRKNMGYVIETLEEREVNGYRFKDFRIRRRENGISGRNAAKRKG